MHVLFIVLNQVEYLDDILTEFVNIGISGATVLDSQGMARAINDHEKIPIFGSLRSLLDSSRPYNKTIFTVVQSDELLDMAMESVNRLVGDFCKPGIGLMFSVPIGRVCGLPKSIDKEK